MEDHHCRFLATLESTKVERPRVVGTIAAFDLRTDETSGYLNQIGREFRVRAMDRGLLLRPLGNTVYLMPPYSLTEEEREEMYTGVRELVESA
jgi:adenosylmethionine-8-amino-7-oxononanoate aminotransferase